MSIFKLNDLVQVIDILTGVWRDAQIIELSEDHLKKVKIHFLNFSKKYDIEYNISKILFYFIK